MLNVLNNANNATYTHSMCAGSSFFSSSNSSGMSQVSNPTNFFLLTRLSNIAFNFVFTLPCVLKFLDAYNDDDRKLMLLWSFATVGMVALSALATIAVSSLLLGTMYPPLSLVLTPGFVISCMAQATLLLGTAVLASQHDHIQNALWFMPT